MKTHQLASALNVFAKALKAGANMEIGQLAAALEPSRGTRKSELPNANDAALSLSTLVALSKFTKAEWRHLIREWQLPIEIPTSYSARDSIGALFRYLDKNPEALRKLQRERASKSTKASPELLRTLSLLLGTSKE